MTCSVCQLPLAEALRHPGPSSSGRVCPFCSAAFSRVDGARRHAKYCPQRQGRTLHAGKRGRKTKSCDRCSRIKVHCNAGGQTPCARCSSRKLDCTFSRCCTDPTHRKSLREKPLDPQDDTNGCAPLSFLLNVTDDKQDLVTERAVGEEPDGALLGPTCMTSPQAQAPSDETFEFIDPTLLLPSDPSTSLVTLELDGLYNTEEQSLLGAFLSPQPQEDQLSARLDLLEFDVAAHANSGDRYRGSFDSANFRRFFTVSNVHSFAMMFCRKRHYRYPIIHWPTFSLEKASLPLLIVVALTGATYSYRPGYGPEHITNARKFYHLADSYVFHQLRQFLGHLGSGIDLPEAIQLCQAALLMYALDTHLAGDLAMQHAAITERLPALISAMRKLQFIGCQHSPSEDWQLFLQREHIIRLVAWTFNTDCLATLTCNNPPIFSLLEMSGDLPCDAALWDADSASTFESLISSRQGNSHCLKDLMSELLKGERRIHSDWENLPLFHLHVMMCGECPARPVGFID